MPKRKLPREEGQSSNSTSSSNVEEKIEEFSLAPSKIGNDDMKRLEREFFDVSCVDLAKQMLGKLLVRKITQSDGKIAELTARIVETEAYLGGDDKASHSYKGKQTPKNKAMFMAPGTAYVYSIHTYVCLNISAKNGGAAVLIRSCEPLKGDQLMTEHRSDKPTKNGLKFKELCNGPSKLCIALRITKEAFNQVDLTTCDDLHVADDNYGDLGEEKITCCPRIGIGNYAEEWTDKPLRFYITDSEFVSVKYKPKQKKVNK